MTMPSCKNLLKHLKQLPSQDAARRQVAIISMKAFRLITDTI